jgi:membrane protein YqaA with SNARE-associated domain
VYYLAAHAREDAQVGSRMTGYLALFVWSFLAATLLPLASEPLLIALVRLRGDLVAPVLTATIGNYLGACTTYWIARVAVQRLAGTEPRRGDRRATALLTRFGAPALLFSWVPIIGDAIVALSGGAGIRFGVFSLWVLAGKLARYAAVAAVASRI